MATNSSSNPFAPQEPSQVLALEKYDFTGVNISEIFYGFTIVLFFKCMVALLQKRHVKLANYYLALYTLILFSFGTVFMAMNVHLMQLSFIDDRDYPGGPEGYSASQFSTALAIVPNASFIICNWLADGLLLFRTKVIWHGQVWILILPFLMYLGSISIGIMFIFQSSRPNASLFTQGTLDFGLPYFALSTSLNVLLTLMISFRLALHQHRMRQIHSSNSPIKLPYSSVISMLVESSALYAVFSLLFIGTYAAGNEAADIFLPILSQTQIIAPFLIISRVASQRAWTSADSQTVSSRPTQTLKSNSTLVTRVIQGNNSMIPLEDFPKFSHDPSSERKDAGSSASLPCHEVV